MRRLVRLGPLVFRDPLLLCGALYLLLWSDASGFLRIGLCAAVLHEMGHIFVYLLLFRRFPVIEVTMTGFCMRTRGQALTRGQTLFLAAAGPGMNALLAAIWAMRMSSVRPSGAVRSLRPICSPGRSTFCLSHRWMERKCCDVCCNLRPNRVEYINMQSVLLNGGT